MKRVVSTLLILMIGGMVLWEVIAQGTKTWVKYGLMKQPLPSLTTLLPISLITTVLSIGLLGLLIATTLMALAKSKKIFGLVPLSELTRHIVVLGPTGSGKTTVAKVIANKVLTKDNVSLIVIDWKGEYVQHLPDATIVRKIANIWDVPGDNPQERALVAAELIREAARDVIDISPPSALLLLRVLEEEYRKGVPTTETVMAILDRYAQIAQREGRYAEANMYLALLRRLYVILVDEGRQAQNVEGDPQIVVYDLSQLPSVYIKTLYANYVLATLYRSAVKAGTSDRLKVLLIAEEAQNYVRPRRRDELPSIGERLIFELRAFGVGAVLICPDPELLPEAVSKDVGSIVSLSPDTLPRFALERFLFRASLEEAEKTLKELKKAKMIVYYRSNLNSFRRIQKPPKVLRPKVRPKGDRMGVTDPGVGSLRTWPILPRRSPGRPAPKVVEVEEEVKKPEVIEIREEAAVEEKPKVVEVKKESEPRVIEIKEKESGEELRLEEEEFEEEPEAEVEVEKSPETVEEPVEEVKIAEEEKAEMLEEEMPLEESKPEPAPKGPPTPSSLPYRGSLCPAGRPTALGRSLF
jgi:energy-coupling factor transporter ATP-binding protein EcfA2